MKVEVRFDQSGQAVLVCVCKYCNRQIGCAEAGYVGWSRPTKTGQIFSNEVVALHYLPCLYDWVRDEKESGRHPFIRRLDICLLMLGESTDTRWQRARDALDNLRANPSPLPPEIKQSKKQKRQKKRT